MTNAHAQALVYVLALEDYVMEKLGSEYDKELVGYTVHGFASTRTRYYLNVEGPLHCALVAEGGPALRMPQRFVVIQPMGLDLPTSPTEQLHLPVVIVDYVADCDGNRDEPLDLPAGHRDAELVRAHLL